MQRTACSGLLFRRGVVPREEEHEEKEEEEDSDIWKSTDGLS